MLRPLVNRLKQGLLADRQSQGGALVPASDSRALERDRTGSAQDLAPRDPREWLLATSGKQLPKASAGGGRLGFILAFLAMMPSIFGLVYFGFWASDRYVSESRYLVRTASRSDLTSELSSLFKVAGTLTGTSNAQGEIYTVQEYLGSREIVTDLGKSINLREIYGSDRVDMLFRYPSPLFGKEEEEFYRYLMWRLNVTTNQTTGMSTLRVEAPTPEAAHRIGNAMLDLAERKINELNERIRTDAISNAQAQLERSEQRVVQAQANVTAFRNRELLVDARQSSMIFVGVIAQLNSERTRLETELKELLANSPNSPFTANLQARLQAVEQQIIAERARVSDPNARIALNLAEYENLVTELEFARAAQKAALGDLEKARAEARRQQLYLLRIVPPNLPDYAIHPQRTRMILSIFAVNFVIVLVIWLFAAGIREHSGKA